MVCIVISTPFPSWLAPVPSLLSTRKARFVGAAHDADGTAYGDAYTTSRLSLDLYHGLSRMLLTAMDIRPNEPHRSEHRVRMRIMDNKVSRRRFLTLAGISTLGAAVGLAGCAQSRDNNSASNSSPSSASDDATASANEDSSAPAATSGTGNSLVLVFSRADENMGVGTVETGNTMVLAQMIAKKTGADLFEIERVTAYPAGYDDCCDEALEEQRANDRPDLKALPDIAGYDTVYFGFPCWWGDLPMPVYTAVEALDWNGKTISPFNTHEGSGESGMFSTLASKCTGATVTDGLTMTGTKAQNNRSEAESEVDSWLASLQ